MTPKQDLAGMRVCVTGATGFIGSYIIQELLEQGCHVLATVRDKKNTESYQHLIQLQEKSSKKASIEFYEANLLKKYSYDDPFQNADYVVHVAAMVRFTSKDYKKDILEPNIEGTRNVLASIVKCPNIKKVIFISSIASVTHHQVHEGYEFDEKDWNLDPFSPGDAYSYSKTQAELLLWDEYHKLCGEKQFKLVSLNPSMVLGPAMTRKHMRTSLEVLKRLYFGKMPGVPNLSLSFVDVRDIAAACLRALQIPEVEGRFILSHETKWLRDVAKTIKNNFPESKAPLKSLPNFVMYASSFFIDGLSYSFLRRSLGRVKNINGNKAKKELGITYHDIDKSIVDTCHSFH